MNWLDAQANGFECKIIFVRHIRTNGGTKAVITRISCKDGADASIRAIDIAIKMKVNVDCYLTYGERFSVNPKGDLVWHD